MEEALDPLLVVGQRRRRDANLVAILVVACFRKSIHVGEGGEVVVEQAEFLEVGRVNGFAAVVELALVALVVGQDIDRFGIAVNKPGIYSLAGCRTNMPSCLLQSLWNGITMYK